MVSSGHNAHPDRTSSAAVRRRNQEIVRLYGEEGLSPEELAARHGLSLVTVVGILRAAGVSFARPGRRPDDLRQRSEEIAHAYVEDGLTLTEVGRRFGLGPTSVSWILARAGVSRTKPGRPPSDLVQRKQEIIRLGGEVMATPTVVTNLRLSPELAEWLRQEAFRQGTTQTALLVKALEMLRREQSK